MTVERREPPRDDRPGDLEDAGPALRIEEVPILPDLAKGYHGWGQPRIQGPPQTPSPTEQYRRAAEGRAARRLLALGAALLLALAGAVFLLDGLGRQDRTVQSLGLVALAAAGLAAIAAVYVARTD